MDRLTRWRRAVPFEVDESNGTAIPGAVLDGGDLWRLRLSTAGLDEDRLLSLLACPPAEHDAAAAIDTLCRGTSAPGDHRRPFLTATGDLMDRLRGDLAARAREFITRSTYLAEMVPDPDALVAGLVEQGIAAAVDTMLHRSMLAEMARARAARTLIGSTSAQRFDSFTAGFADPDRRRSFYDEYPLLAQRIVVAAELWREATDEFLTRLLTDLPDVLEKLGAPAETGPLVAVTTGLGDLHRGARSVAQLEFASGWKVVYKPRPFGVDAHFQDLVAWINARVDGLALRTVRCLDRGSYGWMEFVESRPCESTGELRAFYRRQGALLALLYVLHANDISAENLIAAGDQPVLIDLETLLQPRLDALRHADRTPAESAATDLVTSSVIHAGLLPSGAAGFADLSGMSLDDGTLSSVRIAHVEAGGTDRMRVRLRQAELPRNRNQPHRVAGTVRLRDYADNVVTGFREVYDVLRRHRAELTAHGGPLAAFRHDEVRVLLRDTSTYGMILGMSFHPRLLRDRWDQEQHLDLLWREVATKPGLAAATESERAALWRCDIPAFAVRVDGTEVLDDRGAVVLDSGVTSGWQVVGELLDRLGEDDLARQIWLIRACLLTNGVRWDQPAVMARDAHTPARAPVENESLLRVAQRVAERLGELAVEDSEHAVWLGVHTSAGTHWEVGVVGPDLYSGGLGIALFLAHYAEISSDTTHRDRARRAVAAALRQIERGRLAHGGGELGLLGLGGAVYALSELGALWQRDELLWAAIVLAKSMPRLAEADEEFAVLDGCAGALLGLGALARAGRGGAIRDIVRGVADRLVTSQGTVAAAWLPRRMRELGIVHRPLAGYGHGASGVASALATASEILGDTGYLDAALRAVRYERTLFDSERGNWRDIRALPDTAGITVERRGDWAGTEGNSIAWCHGAAGIGLARLHLLRHCERADLRAELDTALETTLRGGFGNGHSLCHGDFGSLELAVTVAAERADDALWHRLRRHAAAVVDDITRNGHRCGLYRDLEVPGLYTGLAGIGYGAMRVCGLAGGPVPLIGPAR
ncbi:type 2 lanthipeptide synthetase LanM family protein [Nocardia blacklockiae]|uniref:type 2 lanthipeptide synthetase LanM family protein n=1 Tax=Nocardia blacklockiae TaxID=480036 RepID=UPI001893A0DF|nr:type 2 lanthipeptide synthetase LanM family protein [Nocardia blacklockiae]MBF6174890.1 type 2 lantipeptide synthetase LanM family protein [Nocardia blacklockiae]